VKIPDLISPIVGHRVWRWDASGLRSLNGKPWSPRQRLAANCGAGNAHDADEPPYLDCTCGVYAAKNIEHLRQLGYEGRGIRGEVHLWGTVVEHELGWRAQFAYPKTLFLPPHLIPSDTKEMEVLLGALAAYDIDIFMLGGGRKIPLCRKGAGFDAEGLDYLIRDRTRYYERRQRDRTLMRGDRVAVLGRGIAVVEHANDAEVLVVLGNRVKLRMRRKDIAWNRQNMRWEAEAAAP
jgi:preprotein translocase subunit YajC